MTDSKKWDELDRRLFTTWKEAMRDAINYLESRNGGFLSHSYFILVDYKAWEAKGFRDPHALEAHLEEAYGGDFEGADGEEDEELKIIRIQADPCQYNQPPVPLPSDYAPFREINGIQYYRTVAHPKFEIVSYVNITF